jgi:PhzF family phenazine biosynthesis protein
MVLSLFHVDAFTDRPFAGNPAAVCLLPSWKEDRWLQAVAREMNLSETAFLVKQPNYFDLRWFTAKVEMDLCGHATRKPTLSRLSSSLQQAGHSIKK